MVLLVPSLTALIRTLVMASNRRVIRAAGDG